MPPPLVLPVAEYKPDLPDVPGDGSNIISGVYPRTSLSYGAILGPQPVYNALNARCQGAVAFRDITGNVHAFAGDASNLYTIQTGAWANISRSPASYSIDTSGQWQFVYFNNNVIATDYNDPLQSFNMGTGTAFADIPDAPRGRYIAVVKNAFVLLGDTFDASNGAMPQRLQWCDAGNAMSWSTPGTTRAAQYQAGSAVLFGAGGRIQGFASDLVNADAIVFQEFSVKRMMYVGPPDIFSLLPVENARGCAAPNSIVVSGGYAYYLGQDGFYAFDGGQSVPIGFDKIDKTVLADLDLSYVDRVVGCADPVNRLIWWAYPGAGNSGGNPNRLLIYNFMLNRWSLAEQECETITKMLSIGYTLDELYTVLGYSLDTLPAPLDSSIWTGGRMQMGLFGTNHKLHFLTGLPLEAIVETQEMEPIPGRRVMVKNARPNIDGLNTVCNVRIGTRDRLQAAVSYGSPSIINALGLCPGRKSGRYVRAKFSMNSNTSWTNISGIELEIVPQGVR